VVTGFLPKQYRRSKSVRLEAGRHIRSNRKEYLEAKIDELETNSKIKNCKRLA
jgi:hypothetical protein